MSWSSFNKPTRVADALGLGASEFVYGPSRARVKHTQFEGAAVAKTITYIGADFERRAPESGPAALVHFIRAGGNVVAEFTKLDDANPATDKTRYLHRDHLGSVALVTDEAGAIAEERAFGPWGEARNTDWSTPASPPPLLETPRGFTGHEHIETVGLIHMNGRVYDPAIGKFMSPDPSDALNPGVGFNRYAYVKNNPVSFADPSGFLRRDSNGNVVFDPISGGVMLEHPSGPKSVAVPGNVYADDGRPIDAFKNVPMSANPGFNTDCHGCTFADCDVWINDDQLPDILAGDGYAPTTEPKVGDIVVYTKDGVPVHSATVVDIDPVTGEVTVEGLGGLETEVHRNPVTPGPGGAWEDPDAEFEYHEKREDFEDEEIREEEDIDGEEE